MKRLYWSITRSLAGGFVLIADNTRYHIQVFTTIRGERAQVMDYDFTPIGSETTVENAKRRVRQLENNKNGVDL